MRRREETRAKRILNVIAWDLLWGARVAKFPKSRAERPVQERSEVLRTNVCQKREFVRSSRFSLNQSAWAFMAMPVTAQP